MSTGELKCQRFEASLHNKHINTPTQARNNSSLNVILQSCCNSGFQRYKLEVFFTSKFLSSACQQFLTAEMSIAPSQDRENIWKQHF